MSVGIERERRRRGGEQNKQSAPEFRERDCGEGTTRGSCWPCRAQRSTISSYLMPEFFAVYAQML